MKVDSRPAELPHFVGPGNPKISGAPGRLHGPHQKEPVKSIQRPHSRTVFYSLSHGSQENDLQKTRNPETLYQFLLQDTHRHDLADLQRDARPEGFPVSKKVMKIDNIKKHIFKGSLDEKLPIYEQDPKSKRLDSFENYEKNYK